MRSGRKFHISTDASEEEGETDWQSSYSDLITDLLAIFVVLFSFAMMSQAIENSKPAAGSTITVGFEQSTMQNILPGQDNILPDNDSLNSLIQSINSYIDEAGLSEPLSVTKQGDNLILLRAADSVFFKSGRAEINSNAEPLLGRISEILTEYADSIKMVRIEGHTDNIPMKNKQFDSNWELSTSRAVIVLRRLLEITQLGPDKFSAVGYGEFHPIADNDAAAGRTLNRRVDFIIETLSD
jgi:chemotaxis protein MotB